MKYVAILKTVEDLEEVPPNLRGLPKWYPLETTNAFEAPTVNEVQKRYPNNTVYPQIIYKARKQVLDQIYDTKRKPRAWWKFW